MSNRKFLLPLLALMAMPAFAQDLNYEIGYTTVGADDGGLSIDLGGIYGSIGYVWNESGSVSHSVEALAAFGVQDDSFFGVDVNLEPSLEIAYRGDWETTSDDLGFFYRVSYARIELEVDGFGSSDSESESGVGIGIGGTWRGFTLGYTQYLGDLEDFNRINIGYRF